MRLFRRGKVWYGQYYGAAGERIQRSTQCHDYRAAERKLRDWERHADSAADPATTATMSDALSLMVESREAEARAGKLTGRRLGTSCGSSSIRAANAVAPPATPILPSRTRGRSTSRFCWHDFRPPTPTATSRAGGRRALPTGPSTRSWWRFAWP